MNATRIPLDEWRRRSGLAHIAIRAKGTKALRPSELRLMAAGRFQEAARAIYDRAYGAGWVAAHRGNRQLPERKAGAA